MKCAIVLNGDFTENYDFGGVGKIIACDAAFSELQKRGINPDIVLGDFDSLGFTPENAIKYPVEKDMTDGELAIEYAFKEGYKDIDIVSFGGKREDHFLGNLSLLIKAKNTGLNACGVTNYSKIFYLEKGNHSFEVDVGKTVSLFTFESCLVKESSGLKYPYYDTTLKCDSTLGISNLTTEKSFSFEIVKGSVFLIINH